jgi:hypothetical protein
MTEHQVLLALAHLTRESGGANDPFQELMRSPGFPRAPSSSPCTGYGSLAISNGLVFITPSCTHKIQRTRRKSSFGPRALHRCYPRTWRRSNYRSGDGSFTPITT